MRIARLGARVVEFDRVAIKWFLAVVFWAVVLAVLAAWVQFVMGSTTLSAGKALAAGTDESRLALKWSRQMVLIL